MFADILNSVTLQSICLQICIYMELLPKHVQHFHLIILGLLFRTKVWVEVSDCSELSFSCVLFFFLSQKREMKMPSRMILNKVLSVSVTWATVQLCWHDSLVTTAWPPSRREKKTMLDLMCLIQVKNNLELWYVEFFSLSTHVVPKPPHSSNASTRSSFKVRQNVCLLLCAIVTAHRLNKKYCHVKKPPVWVCTVSLGSIFIKIFCHCSVLLVS